MTAPAKDRFEVDLIKPFDLPRTTTLTSDIAVQRMVSLLSEIVAQGALPAL